MGAMGIETDSSTAKSPFQESGGVPRPESLYHAFGTEPRLLFLTLNREDFSFVIHLDRQPRTSRRREAQTGSRARSGSRSERTLDAVEHSRTLMEWCPFLIFHRGGLRIKVINNGKPAAKDPGRARFGGAGRIEPRCARDAHGSLNRDGLRPAPSRPCRKRPE